MILFDHTNNSIHLSYALIIYRYILFLLSKNVIIWDQSWSVEQHLQRKKEEVWLMKNTRMNKCVGKENENN